MSRRHRRLCPTATKTAFPDRIAADLALAEIQAEHDRAPVTEKVPVRSYLCPCGKWHLTAKRYSYDDVAAGERTAEDG